MSDIVFCNGCGLRSPSPARFCRECGSPLVHELNSEVDSGTTDLLVSAQRTLDTFTDQASESPTQSKSVLDDGVYRSVIKKPRRRGSFIGLHWRGEYSLPVSIIIVGAVAVAVVSGYWLVTENIDQYLAISPTIYGLIMVSQAVLSIGIALWYVVGAWRSSIRQVAQTGDAKFIWMVWGFLAIGLGWLLLLNGPIIWTTLNTGANIVVNSGSPGYEIRLINDGKEVVFKGAIEYGASNELAAILREETQVKIIHLESKGGFVKEGSALGDVITDVGLKTYTAGECSSACVLAFTAGTSRFLGENARLGFHSARIGSLDGKSRGYINDEFVEVFTSRAISKSFIERAVNHNPNEMWYPSHEELAAAGVIDAVVNPVYFGSSQLTEWSDFYALEADLLSNEVYSLIKRHNSELYSQVINTLVEGFRSGMPSIEIQTRMREEIFSVVLSRYLSRAPDSELLAYYQTMLDEIRVIRDVDSQHCADFVFPQFASSPIDLMSLLPAELQERDNKNLSRAFKAALERPIADDDELGEQVFLDVIDSIGARNPEFLNVLAYPSLYRDDPVALCDTAVALYEELLLPERRATIGPALRYITKNT